MRIMNHKGSITPALLIITSAFVVIIYGMLSVLSLQLDSSHRQTASEEALNIAEAGINYYRWHLAHDPNDFTDGTGNPGPYNHNYYDPQGKLTGNFSLDITSPQGGSSIVVIISTGRTLQYPSIERTITVQYGKGSYSKYAFLVNSSIWFGSGSVVNGEIHSNNGIRMDGINNSKVKSAQEEYMCGGETGCNPPQNKPGVWGSGPNSYLWEFPAPSIDFNSISYDLANMKDNAMTDGLYLAPSGSAGYHLVFQSDGNVTVYKITATNYYRGYSVPGQGLGVGGGQGQGGCQKHYQIIVSESPVGSYEIAQTPIIFSESNLWVEGTIKGNITVVAAQFPIASNNTNIWIYNNLVYSSYDGSNRLGLIAENDIYFARDIPENFRVDGALIAQTGQIIRHGYFNWCGGTNNAIRGSLTINGALASFYKSYWNYGTAPDSGFINRIITYDTNLLYNPPPYFPVTGDFEIISWREE